jgi:hypothetical protein
MTLLNQLAFERRNAQPTEPTAPVKASAEGILAAWRKATGEMVELPQGNDAAAVGARAIIAAYEKCLKGE